MRHSLSGLPVVSRGRTPILWTENIESKTLKEGYWLQIILAIEHTSRFLMAKELVVSQEPCLQFDRTLRDEHRPRFVLMQV